MMDDEIVRSEALARFIDGADEDLAIGGADLRELVARLEEEVIESREIEDAVRERVWKRVRKATRPPRSPRLRPRRSIAFAAGSAVIVVALLIVYGAAQFVLGGDRNSSVAEALVVQAEGAPPVVTYLHGGVEQALDIQTDSFGDRYLQWSPDGSRLAFVNGGDIWLLESSGEKKRLTDTPERVEGLIRWSPDGQQLAFASAPVNPGEPPDAAAPVGGRLTLMNANGSGYRVVGQKDGILWPPSWSADGVLIAYSARGQLRIFDVATGGEAGLLPAQVGLPQAQYIDGVSFSPVSSDLVTYYSAIGEEPSRASLIDGSAPQVEQGFAIVGVERQPAILTRYEAPFVPGEPPRWSPDGTQVLISLNASPIFGNPTGLWIVNTMDGVVRRAQGVVPYQALWAPSGGRIAYIDIDSRSVNVIDADSLELIEQVGPPGGVAGIAWRPASSR